MAIEPERGRDQQMMAALAVKTLQGMVDCFEYERLRHDALGAESFVLRLRLGAGPKERRYTAVVTLGAYSWVTRRQSDREIFESIGPGLVAEILRKLHADERDAP